MKHFFVLLPPLNGDPSPFNAGRLTVLVNADVIEPMTVPSCGPIFDARFVANDGDVISGSFQFQGNGKFSSSVAFSHTIGGPLVKSPGGVYVIEFSPGA